MAAKSLQELPQEQRPRSKGAVALARTGLTQAEIAMKLGVSEALVSHWMPGRRVPPLPKRRQLQVEFDIPIESWDEPASTFDPPPPYSGTRLTSDDIESLAVEILQIARHLVAQARKSQTLEASSRALRDAVLSLEKAKQLAGVKVRSRLDLDPDVRQFRAKLRDLLLPFPDALEAVETGLEDD